jgi:hypothetical protein
MTPFLRFAFLLGLTALAAGPALAQDGAPQSLVDWSATTARSAFVLCRGGEPDASEVTEHGQIVGWPSFTPYLEHPDGFKRTAGGESRKTDSLGDATAYVELTVQSGQVTAAQPADITYFRCNVASDQTVNGPLEAFFTAYYGAPTSKTDASTVWVVGAPDGAAAASDDALLKAAEAGADNVTRIELTRERGLDRAKMTVFRRGAD